MLPVAVGLQNAYRAIAGYCPHPKMEVLYGAPAVVYKPNVFLLMIRSQLITCCLFYTGVKESEDLAENTHVPENILA